MSTLTPTTRLGDAESPPLTILGLTPSDAELAICRALSARVKVALRCLDRGDADGARRVLQQCDRVLPLPSKQNMLAAEDCLRRFDIGEVRNDRTQPNATERSRRDAINAGEKHYFTGKACKHGHVAARETLSGACVECRRELVARDKQRVFAAMNGRDDA